MSAIPPTTRTATEVIREAVTSASFDRRTVNSPEYAALLACEALGVDPEATDIIAVSPGLRHLINTARQYATPPGPGLRSKTAEAALLAAAVEFGRSETGTEGT